MASAPRLSYVLVADRAETIEDVLRNLETQTARDVLEVVVVAEPDGRPGLEERLAGFSFAQVLQVPSIHPLPRARLAGVEAARARVVFLGETHTFPGRGFVEALVAAHDGSWAAVAPALGNANPETALSWAGFLTDYGRWFEPESRAEATWVPAYNCSFDRDVLLSFGDELELLLEPSAGLAGRLREAGHRLLVEPAARIDHLNVDSPRPWLAERFLQGRVVGTRADGWETARRAAYALGSPLVPPLILYRNRRAVGKARHRLPRGTVAALVLGVVVAAAGELVTYLRGPRDAEERMLAYEVHKNRFVSRPTPG